MKIKEIIQLIIANCKSNSKNQTLDNFRNKNRINFFIAGAIFVGCGAFYQGETRAQLQQNFSLKTEPVVLKSGELPPKSSDNKNEDELNPSASRNIPSIYPVMGKLTDTFGNRINPFGKKSREFHKGLDIAAPVGTAIVTPADGVVIFAGWQGGYGNIVIIDHGRGLTTRYGHLSQINTAIGQTIKRGDILGKVGSTGRSTGAHLHYEVRVDNQAVDPTGYLPLNR